MFDVKKMVEEITSKKEINNISFTGVGGSLACFYAPYYYVTREAKNVTTSYTSSNEFVHDTPSCITENSIVVISSRGGNTAETVEAGRVAKKLGATVVGMTHEEGENGITEVSDYVILFKDLSEDVYEVSKTGYILQIAIETLHQVENTGKYDEMMAAVKKMNEIVPAAEKAIVPEAIKFSIDFKDDNVIYTMGSGTSWSAAQQQQICILMEMQWINSSVIHTGEFFHGPFEITNPDTAFLLLKSSGKTRVKIISQAQICYITKQYIGCHKALRHLYQHTLRLIQITYQYYLRGDFCQFPHQFILINSCRTINSKNTIFFYLTL